MRKSKFALTGFAIVATVGSAFALRSNLFTSGSVYCSANCFTAREPYRLDPNGTVTVVSICGYGGTAYVLTKANSMTDFTCEAVGAGSKFKPTDLGK